MMFNTAASPLINQIWVTEESASLCARLIRLCALSLAGSAFLAISAQVSVAIGPAPFSMQNFAVLLLGAVYGWRLGVVTVALYLAEGAMGLPVFVNGGSQLVLIGPTAGYLYGFVAAAAVVGWFSERGWGQTPIKVAITMVIGNVVIYVGGISWLSHLIGLEISVELGMIPFLIGDALKIALAAAVLPLAWKLAKKRRT